MCKIKALDRRAKKGIQEDFLLRTVLVSLLSGKHFICRKGLHFARHETGKCTWIVRGYSWAFLQACLNVAMVAAFSAPLKVRGGSRHLCL